MSSEGSSPPRAGRTVSRRAALWSGAGVLAVGAGAAAGYLLPAGHTTRDEPPPPLLTAAIAAEEQLLRLTSAAPPAGLADAVAQAHADHQAHLAALQAVRDRYGTGSTPTRQSAPSAVTAPALHAAETEAAGAAATRAATATGTLAGLLASIAACEATHATLFG
jgi:hypothetical protein